jgi:hypothetical protein
MDHDPPSPEAHGRVTDPERYSVLHDAANQLLGELDERYVVARTDGLEVDQEIGRMARTEAITRLAPHAADAAPLVIAITSFPGVIARFGRWHIEAFPRCGCDACDEDPLDLVEQVQGDVRALVEGRFREAIVGRFRPGLTYAVAGHGPSHSGWSRLSRRQARDFGGPAALSWHPWIERSRPAGFGAGS